MKIFLKSATITFVLGIIANIAGSITQYFYLNNIAVEAKAFLTTFGSLSALPLKLTDLASLPIFANMPNLPDILNNLNLTADLISQIPNGFIIAALATFVVSPIASIFYNVSNILFGATVFLLVL